MHRFSLAWGITVRMMAWGAMGGALLGCAYGFLLISFGGNSSLNIVGGLVGFVLGGLLGLVLGLLDGLVLAAVTYFTVRRTLNPNGYRIAVYSVSIVVTMLGALIGFGVFTVSLRATNLGWILYTLLPALLATVIAWRASVQIIEWVEKKGKVL